MANFGRCGVVQHRVHWRYFDRETARQVQRLIFRFTRRTIQFLTHLLPLSTLVDLIIHA